LGRRVELTERGTERQKARRKREFVVVDEAADGLGERLEFALGKIDPRQAFLLKALKFRLATVVDRERLPLGASGDRRL
jgi:hypothetical protein